jgi:hypothetical protein
MKLATELPLPRPAPILTGDGGQSRNCLGGGERFRLSAPPNALGTVFLGREARSPKAAETAV